MRKFLTAIARFLAAIFAIFFILTALLAVLLTTLGWKLFDPRIYKQALAEQQIYERLPGLVGVMLTGTLANPCTQNPVVCDEIPPELKACYQEALGSERYVTLAGGRDQPTEAEKAQIQSCLDRFGAPAQPEGDQGGSGQVSPGGMPPFMQNLDAADWEAILRAVMPPEELHAMVDEAIDQVFAYLNGQSSTASLSLVELKNRLRGEGGTQMIEILVAAQPPCTLELLAQITGLSGTGEPGGILCDPGQDILPLVLPVFQTQLDSAIAGIPDRVVLIAPPATGAIPAHAGPLGNDPARAIRLIRWILRLSPLVPLAFLLLIAVFAVRSIKGWMRWWGIPLFFTGLIALGLAMAVLPLFDWSWTIFALPRFPTFLPANIVDIGRDVVRYILHSLTNGVVLAAILMALSGLAAWIGSFFIKTLKETPAPELTASEKPA